MTARLPLFDLPILQELEELETKRTALSARLQKLPLNSHKRIALQAKLETLTLQALALSSELASTEQEIRT